MKTGEKPMQKKKITLIDYMKKVVDYNCNKLNIRGPKIKLEAAISEVFATPTTKACMSSDGKVLRVNRRAVEQWQENELPFDLWATLSHECRHAWQAKDKQFKWELGRYKNSAELSKEEYNAQFLEIDAWAWAVIICKDMFGVELSFDKFFSPETCEKVKQRAIEICPPPHPMQDFLENLADIKNEQAIRAKLEECGFFDASKDPRTKATSLVDIVHGGDFAESNWHDIEKQLGFHCKYFSKVKNSPYEFIWVNINKYKPSDEPFEDGNYIIWRAFLYARELK